jgi:hypothetical protein
MDQPEGGVLLVEIEGTSQNRRKLPHQGPRE